MRPLEDADILRLRAQGLSAAAIGERLGIATTVVYERLRGAIDGARAAMATAAEERAAVADARIEWMLDSVTRAIAADAEANVFDDRKYKAAIALLERQARLFGYDRAGRTEGPDDNWLATAPPEKLKQYAKEIGLKIPEKFQ